MSQFVANTYLRTVQTQVGSMSWPQIRMPLLNDGIRSPAIHFADNIRLRNAPDMNVAGANGSYLAGPYQVEKCLHRLGERRVGVIAVRQIDIEPISLKAPKTGLAFPFDSGRIQTTGK